jgi:3-hydroxyisobutyrate dehydrogenase-like beta-hydroxyacid dehydrogenase
MLSDAAAVEAVLHGESGVLAGARQGMVLIDMSTVAPDQSRRIASDLETRGLIMFDAPVMGSTGPAKEGTLGILVGGDKTVLEAHRDLLSTMGNIFYMGPQGSGTTIKLSLNLLVAAQIASLSEAMVLAAKGGLDLAQVGQVIASSGMVSNLIERKLGNIVGNDYQPAFPLKHMHKDLGLMVHTAATLGVALPATGVVHQLYTAARERGHAEEDSAAVYRLLAEMAGLSA